MPSTSSTLPRNLEALTQRVNALIFRDPPIDRRDTLTRSRRLAHFTERSPLNRRSTITIDGERGTGKTTVLLAAMEQLALQPGLVVLPVIRPELFTELDSLPGRVLEALADYVYTLHPDLYKRELGGLKGIASAEFDRIARIEAASRHLPTTAVTTDAEEAAADALLATRRSNEFDVLWRPFISAVLDALEAERLVVPVDDADLAPEHLPSLLSDVRRLDDHPAITCVVALNVADLRDFMRGATLRLSGLPEQSFPRLGAVVSRQIEKALPHQNWVRLTKWHPEQRLSFRLLDSPSPRLEDLLAGVHFASEPLSLRMRGPDGRALSFALALPSRPRPLEHLVMELMGGSPEERQDAFLHALTEHLDDSLREFPRAVPPPFEWSRAESGLTCRLELSQWGFFSDMDPGGWRAFHTQRELSGNSVDIEYQLGRYITTAANHRGEDNAPRFPEEATAAVLLLLDIEARRGFQSPIVAGGRPVQGGDNWRRPRVEVSGEATDHYFLVPPRWEGYLEYVVLNAHLNAVVDHLEEETPARPGDFMEWYAMSHLLMVALLQDDPHARSRRHLALRRQLDPNQTRVIARQPSAWRRTRSRSLRAVMRAVVMAYEQACEHGASDRKANAYVTWFESYLLGVVHPAILEEDAQEIIIEAWTGATARANRADLARASAREWLNRRLTAAGAATWGDAIAELGERLGLGPEFESHQREVESERRARRHAAAETVGKSATQAAPSRTERRPSPVKLSRRDTTAVERRAKQFITSNPGVRSGRTVRNVDVARALTALFDHMLTEVAQGRLLVPSRRTSRT